MITQWATLHPVIFPVKQWAAIVKHISLYHGSSKATPVSAVLKHNQIVHITQKQVRDALRDGVKSFGESKLCINAS